MFEFGKNWESFSKGLTEDALKDAETSLEELFGRGALKGRTFLDIGSGSGLFSVAAVRLGATRVAGIDVDPVSVQVSTENARKWLKDAEATSFRDASVLDESVVSTLGMYDFVYSWGVLHHTGNMDLALKNAARCVKPGGSLAIAIYNRHWTSPIWKVIKAFYNRLGKFGRKGMIWVFVPVIFTAKWLVTLRNPLKMKRGMDFTHNVVDWVGGHPYEYASVDEMTKFLSGLGFEVIKVEKAAVPTGCNEFVSKRTSTGV